MSDIIHLPGEPIPAFLGDAPADLREQITRGANRMEGESNGASHFSRVPDIGWPFLLSWGSHSWAPTVTRASPPGSSQRGPRRRGQRCVPHGELDVAAVEHRQHLVLLLVRLVGAGQVNAIVPLLEDG